MEELCLKSCSYRNTHYSHRGFSPLLELWFPPSAHPPQHCHRKLTGQTCPKWSAVISTMRSRTPIYENRAEGRLSNPQTVQISMTSLLILGENANCFIFDFVFYLFIIFYLIYLLKNHTDENPVFGVFTMYFQHLPHDGKHK